MSFRPADHPHRRRDPLTGRHVLVSPHRANRPWQGAKEAARAQTFPRYDPDCYLCPANRRVGGAINPDYPSVFVFDNDFAAVSAETPSPDPGDDPIYGIDAARGVSRVLCFSPDHAATLPLLPAAAMRAVVEAWCAQAQALDRDYPSVQIFENKGEMMGCSNPHPHGQIWATSYIPDEIMIEDDHQRAYFAQTGSALLHDVAAREIDAGERIVVANLHWLAVVPFWARWPFETLLLPRFPVARLGDLATDTRDSLAEIVQALTTRYDNLFKTSFPYSMGWHGAPSDGRDDDGWQLHAHFYPPLLRSATVRKFMVGFELLAEAQRDLTPEQAAARLRAAGDVHYTRANRA